MCLYMDGYVYMQLDPTRIKFSRQISFILLSNDDLPRSSQTAKTWRCGFGSGLQPIDADKEAVNKGESFVHRVCLELNSYT